MPGPGGVNLLFAVGVVDAAVQQAIQIVGAFAGGQRADGVGDDAGDHGDHEDFVGVDREFFRRDFPDDVRIERPADRRQKVADAFIPSPALQEGIDMLRPFLLQNDAADGNPRTDENRSKGAGRIAEPAVKPPDHHRTGSAELDGGHDHHEHIEIIQLDEQQTEGQKESRHPQRAEPQPQ